MLSPMDAREHWEVVHGRTGVRDVSWYRPHLDRSLRFLDQAGLGPRAAILDVGGGTSTLVDDLLARGFEDVTVLDVSETAIARTKARLGPRAVGVTWLVADITQVRLPLHRYDFWHDRAVFHFLTDEAARGRYVSAVRRALRPHGHVVVATFGPSAPDRCSGLPVVRYDAEGIHAQFGRAFRKVGSKVEVHRTPGAASRSSSTATAGSAIERGSAVAHAGAARDSASARSAGPRSLAVDSKHVVHSGPPVG